MKKLLILMILFLFISCDSSYESEELKAIQDISNDYLFREHLGEIKRMKKNEEIFGKVNVDTLNLKVYLSRVLSPISRIKEDNEWMFVDNDFTASDSIIFYGIVNSRKFTELKYREYDRSKVSLNKPYTQLSKIKGPSKTDEEYSMFSFSRICFDDEKENGVVVMNYVSVSENGFSAGYNTTLLIKKQNNKWVFTSGIK